MSSPQERCLTAECNGKPDKAGNFWRGLCRSCYGQALRLIESEETTWEELEAMELCEVKAKPFTKLFRQKKREATDAQGKAGAP